MTSTTTQGLIYAMYKEGVDFNDKRLDQKYYTEEGVLLILAHIFHVTIVICSRTQFQKHTTVIMYAKESLPLTQDFTFMEPVGRIIIHLHLSGSNRVGHYNFVETGQSSHMDTQYSQYFTMANTYQGFAPRFGFKNLASAGTNVYLCRMCGLNLRTVRNIGIVHS